MTRSLALTVFGALGLLALAVASLGFVGHSLTLGAAFLGPGPEEPVRLYSYESDFSNRAIGLHMVFGAAITILAPLQLAAPVRRRWPSLHRAAGYSLVVCAVPTALGGLGYIAVRGTVGGPLMSVAFALYGLLLALCAVEALRHARAGRFAEHRDWALRLAVLALGSWIYRLHYGLWYAVTGGLASEPDFSGLFDRIQVFAFYVPYLVAVQIWLWHRHRQERAGRPQPARNRRAAAGAK